MLVRFQPGAHVVNFALYSLLQSWGQSVKAPAVRQGPNLKRRAHPQSGLARAVISGGDVRTGLIECTFDFFFKLKLVFEEIFEPFLKLPQIFG